MIRAENATRIVAAIGLLVGFAFVVPPASAAEEAEADTPDLQTTTAIPPCAATPEPGAGPATVGLDDFCNPWVEIVTDAADCRAETDRPDASVDCETAQPTTTADAAPDVCIPFTHEGEIGPVSYTFTGCGVDVSVQTDLFPPGEEDPTERCSVTADEDPKLVLVECQLASTNDGTACLQLYWKVDAVVVVWEQRSSCDGDIYVKDDWQP